MQKIIFKREIHDYFLEYTNDNWYAKAVSGERRDLQIINVPIYRQFELVKFILRSLDRISLHRKVLKASDMKRVREFQVISSCNDYGTSFFGRFSLLESHSFCR